MSAKIKLKNRFIIIDQEDIKRVHLFTWWIKPNGYVYTTLSSKYGPKRTTVYLHHYLIGQDPYRKLQIDHINRNPLDNRKSNLRFLTPLENLRNRQPGKNYYWDQDRSKYAVQFFLNKKVVYCGSFDLRRDAIRYVEEMRKSL